MAYKAISDFNDALSKCGAFDHDKKNYEDYLAGLQDRLLTATRNYATAFVKGTTPDAVWLLSKEQLKDRLKLLAPRDVKDFYDFRGERDCDCRCRCGENVWYGWRG